MSSYACSREDSGKYSMVKAYLTVAGLEILWLHNIETTWLLHRSEISVKFYKADIEGKRNKAAQSASKLGTTL